MALTNNSLLRKSYEKFLLDALNENKTLEEFHSLDHFSWINSFPNRNEARNFMATLFTRPSKIYNNRIYDEALNTTLGINLFILLNSEYYDVSDVLTRFLRDFFAEFENQTYEEKKHTIYLSIFFYIRILISAPHEIPKETLDVLLKKVKLLDDNDFQKVEIDILKKWASSVSPQLAKIFKPILPVFCDVELGKGVYGYVKKVDDTTAVKIFKQDVCNVMQSSTLKEIAILKKLVGAKNCAYLKRYILDPDKGKYYAFIPKGDMNLFQAIPKFHDNEMLNVMKDIINGVKEIHELDIIHLDLKPANIVRIDGVWKIIDFGLAFFGGCFLEGDYVDKQLVTLDYRPPEIQFEGKVSPKVDIYSLGMILLHIATKGRYLYKVADENFDEQLDFIDKIILINIKEPRHQFGPEFMELISKMLDRNPQNRPSIEGVIGSKFFKGTAFIPHCQNIIKNNLKEQRKRNPLLEIPDQHLLKKLDKGFNKTNSRHATYFYTIEFLAYIDRKSGYEIASRLAADVNSDYEYYSERSIKPVKYSDMLEKVDFDILLHTPYSYLFSRVGANETAIRLLYKILIQHPKVYFEEDPIKLVDDLVAYIGGETRKTMLGIVPK